MQKFLSKYALAAHLALTAVAPLFLFPFFGINDIAEVLLWMSFLSFLWIVLEPSRRSDEYLYNARKRVYKDIFGDPLFWVFVIFILAAFAAWLNDGVKLEYGLVNKDWIWTVNSAKLPWLPGSDSDTGFVVFSILTAAMTVVLASRHALGKSARIMFVFLTSLFAGVASLAAVFTSISGVDGEALTVLSDHAAYSFAGSAFGLFFLASVIALAGMYERGWNRAMILFSFALGATFTGLWYFSPPFVTALYSAAGVLLLIVAIVYVCIYKGSLAFFKLVVALLIAAAIPAAIINFVAPDEVVEAKNAIFDFELFSAEYSEARKMYSSMAADIWRRGNIWIGSGLGSLPLFIKLDLPESNWTAWVPNVWWQILVERGLIGFVMVIIPFFFMTITFVARLLKAQFKRAFWPLAFLGVFSLAVAVAEGFFNASFLRPEIFVSVSAFYAVGASSLTSRRQATDADKK